MGFFSNMFNTNQRLSGEMVDFSVYKSERTLLELKTIFNNKNSGKYIRKSHKVPNASNRGILIESSWKPIRFC